MSRTNREIVKDLWQLRRELADYAREMYGRGRDKEALKISLQLDRLYERLEAICYELAENVHTEENDKK